MYEILIFSVCLKVFRQLDQKQSKILFFKVIAIP